MPRTSGDEDALSARGALIIAALAIVLVRMFVPFGGTILYPFTLFATWVHEMGHGLAGLASGGTFEHLEIFANGSGLAHGRIEPGWPVALQAAGGLLAPPILGATILALARGRRRARIVLFVLSAVMLVSVPIWVRSLTGWIALPAVALLIGGLALTRRPTLHHIGAQLLGLLLGLDTLFGIGYLFTGSATIGGRELPSDVAHIADALGGHYLLWGAALALFSLALLALGVRLAWAEPLSFTRKRRER